MAKESGKKLVLAAALAPLMVATDAAMAGSAPIAIAPMDAALQWGPCPPVMPAGCEIALLQGDPTKPNADIFLRVPGGYAIPPHTHSSAERMILTSGRLRVKYQGSPEAMLTPGSYAYGPAGLAHRAICESKESCTLFIAFESAVDAMAADKVD